MKLRLLGTASWPLDETFFYPTIEGEGEGEGDAGGAGPGDGGDASGGDGGTGGGDAGSGDAGKGDAGDKGDAADWRAGITDEAARKFAEGSTDVNHLAQRAAELRQKLSQAIIRPGKGASPEDIAAYHKQIGVPESAEAYELIKPPEGGELTEAQKASQASWASFFRENEVPLELAQSMAARLEQEGEAAKKQQHDADVEFYNKTESALKAEWGADYDKNNAAAKLPLNLLSDDQKALLMSMETKDGHLLLDTPPMLALLAKIGLQMESPGMPRERTSDEVSDINDQIKELRTRRQKALDENDHATANKLQADELALIAKRDGDQPIVGAQGRAA